MGRLVIALGLLSLMPLTAAETVSVVVQFEHQGSAVAVDAMKREVQSLLKTAPVHVEVRTPEEIQAAGSVPDLVVVKFTGDCRMRDLPFLAVPFLYDERGPFAITHVSDGEVLPFSQVACDRVRTSIRGAMNGSDWNRADAILGRALGRVVAHELYHMLSRSRGHEKRGVARSGLSAAQLVSETLVFDELGLQKMHSAAPRGHVAEP